MKTKCILSFFILTVYVTAFAQTKNKEVEEAITFGIKGGLNVSNQSIDYKATDQFKVNSSATTSFHFGIFSNIPFSENFSFQPEVLYSREGSKINLSFEEPEPFKIKFKQMVTYINVPTLIAYQPFEANLSIHVGPQFGFLIKDELDIDIDDGEILDSEYKSFQLSAVFGLEYKIISSLHFGGRYTLGINDISNSDDGSIKNNTLQFYVGYTLF